jgi:hypothetical protein
MHAERLILETDADGNLAGLPRLPAHQRVEAVLLFPGDLEEGPKRRVPPASLKGSVQHYPDPFEQSMSDEEADA